MSRRQPRRRDDAGQVSVLIIGFAFVLALGVAVVVDVSAAYLQRSGLSTLADGAALYGADAGATGASTYTEGVPEDQLALDAGVARAGVEDYLRSVGAHQEYPGLRFVVVVDQARSSVQVRVSAPLDPPLGVPGAPEAPMVSAEGSAVSDVER